MIMNARSVLTSEQVDQFHRDGFVVVRGMYTADEIAEISAWTEELASSPEVPGKDWKYFERDRGGTRRMLSRIENFIPHHAGYARLITRKRMQQAVSELFGEPAVLFKEKINFKLPGGDGFREHQDVQAGWDDYASLHITAMVAIDETNEANGSLEIIPALHGRGLLGEMWAPLSDDDTDHRAYQPVHCQPGDAVFFDSYAPHRSQPNRTDSARRVLYITYNRASEGDHRARYYADKHRSYPPDIEREPGRDYRFKV
jgi:ectoine hydroxylase-related dioxygenase (phytanoyl-CoA dioxygenase family)